MRIGPPKTQGQINDPKGLGNDDFDKGIKISPYGYPILAVYKLQDALTLDDLYSEYGANLITKGKQYAKQAMVDDFPLRTLECLIQK